MQCCYSIFVASKEDSSMIFPLIVSDRSVHELCIGCWNNQISKKSNKRGLKLHNIDNVGAYWIWKSMSLPPSLYFSSRHNFNNADRLCIKHVCSSACAIMKLIKVTNGQYKMRFIYTKPPLIWAHWSANFWNENRLWPIN